MFANVGWEKSHVDVDEGDAFGRRRLFEGVI
jgi:hypothetical protein